MIVWSIEDAAKTLDLFRHIDYAEIVGIAKQRECKASFMRSEKSSNDYMGIKKQ